MADALPLALHKRTWVAPKQKSIRAGLWSQAARMPLSSVFLTLDAFPLAERALLSAHPQWSAA
jgi:hypothetical protein